MFFVIYKVPVFILTVTQTICKQHQSKKVEKSVLDGSWFHNLLDETQQINAIRHSSSNIYCDQNWSTACGDVSQVNVII